MPSSIPGRRISAGSQLKPSTSARTSTATAQTLIQPHTSKSTSTLPRRTTSTPKPTTPTTRVLAAPHVGDRVILENGQKGILRYRGETTFKPGIWAGIELDRPGSGKNSGSVNGISYFQCAPQSGLFVLAQKVQLLERKKLSPSSNEPKTASPPSARRLALQDKLGSKPNGLDTANKPPHWDVAELQEALTVALEENAALKDNQDEVGRLEKLLTFERHQSKNLRLDIDHIKKTHATHRNEQREKLHHLTTSIHELEAVNKVLNSTLTELSCQSLPKNSSSDPRLIEKDTQMKDLQAECKMLSQQLQVEKEKHRVTQMQLDTYSKDQSLAAKNMQNSLIAHRERLQETQKKLDKSLLEVTSLTLEKEKLEAALSTSTVDHQQSQELIYNERQVQELVVELKDKQLENEHLAFTIQELTIALDKAKQDQGNEGWNDKYIELAEDLEVKTVENEKLKLNLADLNTSLSERQQLLSEFEGLKLANAKKTAALELQVQHLEEDMLRLEQERDSVLDQLTKHNSLLKDSSDRQHVINQLLGDISELQSQVAEYRNEIDEQLEEVGVLRIEKEAKNAHITQLQETNKQLETECLKLMDELLTDSVEGTKWRSESPSYALQISHQRTKQLEVNLANMQNELTSEASRLTKEHLHAIKEKDDALAKLNKELSEIEHIVESKIFREAELEEQLAIEQKRKTRLQQEISDLQVSQCIPHSPDSDDDNDSTNGEIPGASNHTSNHTDSKVISERYCGICDTYGHNTIECNIMEPSSLDSLSQITHEIRYSQPKCDYCEQSAEVPHWTEDCPHQQESY
ncbi:hypothetical protein INT43_005247 [Umbelopsis isabellina]|uniref:CAP-Gly domain-containing protein n=1 Tax=Mortierella isabellina TaxID=91625 RepID=A0A8H7U9Y0_MORIS|nr:hypothetical protein INT43_005247 [Umbelopsis isabellina]